MPLYQKYLWFLVGSPIFQGVRMSDERKTQSVLAKNDIKDLLDEVLNFGPENAPARTDISERLRELVRRLEDINRRIDHLSTRL